MKLILIFIGLMFSQTSFAGEFHHSNGFVSGLLHPVFGFDHLLAMLSVGILSSLVGGRAIWLIPLAFVAVMVVGGIWGMFVSSGDFLPIETGIAVSVMLLGISIFVGNKLPMIVGIIFVSIFAIFHGFAHGQEMPHAATPVLYALGFVVSTTVIHIIGVFIGVMSSKNNYSLVYLKYSGLVISAIGVWLLFAV